MNKNSSNDLRHLRESEEKYRKMFERANDAIFTIDPETAEVLEANPKAEEMTGYSASELVGMNAWDLHPPEEHERARQLFDDVSSEGSAKCTDLHFLTKGSERVAVDVDAAKITFGDKVVIQRNCRDVTERRRAEELHLAQRDYYEFVLNMMPVGLGVRKNIDTKPSVEFENEKLRRMFHAGLDDTHHRNWHNNTTDESDETVKATIDDTGVYAEERSYPDGRVFQFTINYYRNPDNTWSELELVRDITRRRRLEDQLKDALEDLEQKVEARTLELRQKQSQLIQSEKMAALGHLVAGVAHEINTPLGALKSNNDLLIRAIAKTRSILENPDFAAELREHPDLQKMLGGIEGLNSVNKTAAERIVTLVKSLRKFARLDEAEQDKVDIHDGLESTLTLVHHELKNRITVHRGFSQLPDINCYPNQLNQVFMNILVNASQAIEGKGDVFIKTYRRDDKAVIEFRDTGKGIAKENLERIFDPGFTTKGAGVGTGLGLSIVYQIVQDHNGNIEVESEVAKGTTIRIVLPIEE
jgi:PAS domain S-box-containing protein